MERREDICSTTARCLSGLIEKLDRKEELIRDIMAKK